MRKLTVALIAPPYENVPPKKFGAIELVVYDLAEELTKLGHRVYVLAAGDSEINAKLISYLPKTLREFQEPINSKWEEKITSLCAAKVVKILNELECDVVHNHCGTIIIPFLDLINHKVITTIHSPIGFYNPYSSIIYEHFKKSNYISLSNNQRKGFPSLNYLATVHNGIDLKLYSYPFQKEDYFAFLGRTSPEKGIKEAILVAKKAGVRLKIAAKNQSDKKYFEEEINPLIDGNQIEFIGEIGPREKNEFLGKARGLLAPVHWEEPFGLVFIESMASGTPVIAFNRGSIPEIIEDKKTGFIIEENDIEAMTRIVKDLAVLPIDKYQIISSNCRESVKNKFTREIMAKNYERVYYDFLDIQKF